MNVVKASTVVFVTGLILSTDYQSYGYPLDKDRLVCDPMEHKYYLAQFGLCSDCEKCFPGDELNPLEGANLGIGLHGATLCLGCQPCSEGTFNSDRRLQWYCSPCTVCADLGMAEVAACTPTHDTTCTDTPPSSLPRLNSLKDSNVVQPYKGKHKNGEDRLYTEFLAITSLALVFVITVALAVYCFWKKKHRRMPVNAEELTKLNTVPRGDDNRTGASLHDIQEEHTDDEDGVLVSQFQRKDTYKRQKKEMFDELKEPLLRRRRQSCQIDYQRRGSKVEPSDMPISLKTVDSKKEEQTFLARSFRLHRLKSLPVTHTELDNCESSFYQRTPSDGFVRFLSKLLAGDRAYRDFAKEAGLEEFNIRLTETEFVERHIADVSYEVIKRVLQILPNLRVIDIYNILNKLGLQDECKSLQEKIEKFKISLT